MLRKLIVLSLLSLLYINNAQALTLKISTLSTDGSSWMNELRAGASEIEQRTEGRVKFKFYPGGVMGDDQAVLRKIRFGQLHGATFTNGSLNKHFPDVQIYNLVLKFRNLDEIDYVREKLDEKIIAGLEQSGLVTFGLSEVGFAYLMSAAPIHSVDDLRKRKIWTPAGNRVATAAIEAFGVTPIPLPIRDVMVALQTGMVDTVAASSVGAIALQWHTQVKYLIDLPLAYVYGILAVNQKTFTKIEAKDQKIIREVLGRVNRKLDEINRRDNIAALDALKNQGIEFIQIRKDEAAQIRGLIDQSNKQMISSGKLSDAMVTHLDRLLEEYRSKMDKP